MTLCSGSIGQKTFFLFLLKKDRIPFSLSIEWMCVKGACCAMRVHYLICFDNKVCVCVSLLRHSTAWSPLCKDIKGWVWCQLFVVVPLIDNAVLQIDIFCSHHNIRHESNTSSEVQYLSAGSLLSARYLRASYHVYVLLGSWYAAFLFPSRNRLWLSLQVSSGW